MKPRTVTLAIAPVVFAAFYLLAFGGHEFYVENSGTLHREHTIFGYVYHEELITHYRRDPSLRRVACH
jgi:hypothetical protein